MLIQKLRKEYLANFYTVPGLASITSVSLLTLASLKPSTSLWYSSFNFCSSVSFILKRRKHINLKTNMYTFKDIKLLTWKYCLLWHTVNLFNFVSNLFSRYSWGIYFHENKSLQKFITSIKANDTSQWNAKINCSELTFQRQNTKINRFTELWTIK